jgi:PAS domain S-box-containing protein
MPQNPIGAAWPFLVSGLLACTLSAYVVYRRRSRTTLYLSLGTLAIGLWALCSGFHLLASDIAVKTAWVHAKYPFTSATPVFWLLTALAYSGSKLLDRRSFLIGLFVYPVVSVLLVATNSMHGLMFKSVFPVVTARYTTIGHTYGAAFWMYALIGYTMIFIGVGVLAKNVIVRKGYVRRQSLVMTIAALTPVAFNVLFLLSPSGHSYLDYTPVSFVITNAAFVLAILKYRMLALMPIARREVIRLMHAPVIVTDRDGYIEDLNPAAREVFGFHRDALLGRVITEVLPALEDVFTATTRHASDEREVELDTADGTMWFKAAGTTIEDGKGRRRGRVFVLYDISELHQARDRAEELSRMKSTFLSNMSHEIRTPLSAILGVSDMLMEQADEDDRELVGLIRESGQRLLRMLNSVLSVSSIQAGTVLHNPETVELKEIVSSIVDEYRQPASDRSIEFIVELPDAPVNGQLDPLHLSHVLSHLVDNAVRYTEDGVIRIGLHAAEDEICIRVSDTGSGIPGAFLARVGSPFHQADSGDTRPSEGAGLGLAVVWGLVDVMGGRVALNTRQGEGSSFRICLPRWSTHIADEDHPNGLMGSECIDAPMPDRSSRRSTPSRSVSRPAKGSPSRSR